MHKVHIYLHNRTDSRILSSHWGSHNSHQNKLPHSHKLEYRFRQLSLQYEASNIIAVQVVS